jgi:hypothetical protein
MVKVGTSDAAVGAEEDGVGRRPVSFEWLPDAKKAVLRRRWLRVEAGRGRWHGAVRSGRDESGAA